MGVGVSGCVGVGVEFGVVVHRQLVKARDRVATGLKKLLETNAQVANMQVNADEYIRIMCMYVFAYMYS